MSKYNKFWSRPLKNYDYKFTFSHDQKNKSSPKFRDTENII